MSKTKKKSTKPKTPKGRNRKLDIDNLIRLFMSELKARTKLEWSFPQAAHAAAGSINGVAVVDLLKMETVGNTDKQRSDSRDANIAYGYSLVDEIPQRLALVWGRAMQNYQVSR